MSEQTTMLELCARAIARGTGHEWDDLPPQSGWGIDQSVMLDTARAVIEALMTPTSEMVLACWQNHHPWGRNAPPPSERPQMFAEMQRAVTADFQAMLRSILTQSETQETTSTLP